MRSPSRVPGRHPRARHVLAMLAAAATSTRTALAVPPAAPARAAATPAPASAARAAHQVRGLTEDQALARARAAGKPVQVTGATTATSTLTANPDGSLALTQWSAPVRKNVGGRWLPLNAALHRNPGGTVSPAVTSGLLTLSGGGTGPLATITISGYTVSYALPGYRLPAPVLSGDSATYPSVLPGVDLTVTADQWGQFTDVLVVKNAQAAANPALRQLRVTARSRDLVARSDSHGDISFTTRGGHVIFTDPAPRMWDSRAANLADVRSALSPVTGLRTDLRTGNALVSAISGPGETARVAGVGVRVTGTMITYSPDLALLTGKSTRWPLYIDPSAGGVLGYWNDVSSYFADQPYDHPSIMQVGYCSAASPFDCYVTTSSGSYSASYTARAFVRESEPSVLDGADVYSSTLYLQDAWSPACDTGLGDFGVQVWSTGGINASTDWDNQPSWTTEQDEKAFAYGYSSSCPENTVGFNVLQAAKAAAAGNWANITFGIRADSETDGYGWKQFTSNVKMTTVYDRAPYTPDAPTTSPPTTCGADDTVGLGDMLFYAHIGSPDGAKSNSLTAYFHLYNTSTGAEVASATGTGYSGTGEPYPTRVPRSVLSAAAGSTATEFTWTVYTSDGTLSSGTLTCHFTYDPTIPGTPDVAACETTSGTIGSPVHFAITPPSSGTTPAEYSVQLNGTGPRNWPATSGDATVSVTPTRAVNEMTVNALSPGGNIGQPATCVFGATAPANAADGDLTGDGIPDLLTPGGPGTGLPPGLWLYKGQSDASLTAGDGQVITSGLDIGVEGNGIAGDDMPSDFNGGQVITGLFTDRGLQDALTYYPAGTNYPGEMILLDGNGDGSVFENADSGDTTYAPATTFTKLDPNGDIPSQVVNGYNSDTNDSAAYPDLLTVSGDHTNGYYLEYYQDSGAAGIWLSNVVLTTDSPDGTMDWSNWTLASMADSAGNTDLFLYNATTGALYLWENFQVNDTTDTASYTPYQISSSWNPGTLSELRAANITGTGPSLWAVTTSGTATSWIVSGIGSAPAITQDTSQDLLTPDHAWRLGDGISGPATRAADTGSGTALSLTGSGGVTWDDSDPIVAPAASFDGTSGAMTSNGAALSATSSFTVSAWVKPATTSGAILGQSSGNTSCMGLAVNPLDINGVTSGYYAFGMTEANSSTAPDWIKAQATSSEADPEVWTHVTATYDASTQWMELYLNGIPAVGTSIPATWTSGCTAFNIGEFTDGGATTRYFKGSIADVQVWNGTALTPTQAATLSGTPGYILFPSDGHQYASGTGNSPQWTTTCGNMTFYQGLLTVKETCTGTTSKTYGASGYPAAVLVLQKDGNLVIYPTAADAAASTGSLWASNTDGNPNDVMFFQPDGNLVIYNTDGQPISSTGTNNAN